MSATRLLLQLKEIFPSKVRDWRESEKSVERGSPFEVFTCAKWIAARVDRSYDLVKGYLFALSPDKLEMDTTQELLASVDTFLKTQTWRSPP